MAQLATLGDEVKIWDPSSFTLKEQFSTSTDGVKDLCWNHDGSLLASTCKTNPGLSVRMMIGDTETTERSTVSHSFELPATSCCVDFASKYVLAGCDDGSLQIFDLQTRKLHKSFTGNKYPVTVARWNWNEQNVAFGCKTGQIMLYHVITGQASSPFKPSSSSQAINQLRYNPYRKSSLASASEDGVVAFWDTNTRSRVHKFVQSHQAPAIDLAFSPVNDHLMVSVGLDKRLVLYDVQGKAPIKTIVSDYPLTSLDMHDGSTVTVGTSRGKVLMYDLRKADVPIITIPAHKSSVRRICFSKKEIASLGASQPREITSPGAAQPREISLSGDDSVVGSHSQYNNGNTNNSVGTGPGGVLSFLRDDSLSLSHNNTANNTTNSYMGHMMSPALSGHPHPYSGGGGGGEFSRSGVNNSTGGASSLYSFLRDGSPHPNSHLSHNTGSHIEDFFNTRTHANSHHSQNVAAVDNTGSHIEKFTSTSRSQIPEATSHTEAKGSPSRPFDLRQTPQRRNPHWATAEQQQQAQSPASVHFKKASPRSGGDHNSEAVPSVNGDSSSPSSAHAHLRSRTDSSTVSSNDIPHLNKALEDFKLEVKALIKDELKQPQVANIQGQSKETQPQLFQEEYLRKLIRDELETVMEQSHKDYIDLHYQMGKLHFEMWWWLDHRFSEQLNNPALMEQIDRLTEEVNRLRRGYRY